MEAAAAAGDGAAAPAVSAGTGTAAAFVLPDAEPPLLCSLAWRAVTDCMQMRHILHLHLRHVDLRVLAKPPPTSLQQDVCSCLADWQ